VLGVVGELEYVSVVLGPFVFRIPGVCSGLVAGATVVGLVAGVTVVGLVAGVTVVGLVAGVTVVGLVADKTVVADVVLPEIMFKVVGVEAGYQLGSVDADDIRIVVAIVDTLVSFGMSEVVVSIGILVKTANNSDNIIISDQPLQQP